MHTILIVEDDDGIRLSLRDFLSTGEMDVLVASDGVGALQHLVDHDVEAIVTDYRMEPLGGDYWMRFLARFCPTIPIFVISGYALEKVGLPYPVFPKPFEYQQLKDQVLAALEKPRQ